MMGSRPPFEFRISKYEPKAPSRCLIRCEWCGMSYDGNEHVNCPHCNAPRSDDVEEEKPKDLVPRLEELERQAEEYTTFYADNVLYVTYDQFGQVVAPEDAGERRPATTEPCVTVSRDCDTAEKFDESLTGVLHSLVVAFCIAVMAAIIYAVFFIR